MSKVSIIGAGAVGSTTAYLLSETPWVKEIVLVDVDKDRAQGQALDMMHGVGVSQTKRVMAGDYEATQGSDVIIITMGVPEKVGASRLTPLQKNADILKEIVPQMTTHSPNAKIVIVSNPVDILAYTTYQISGKKASDVMGLGTLLDTSRLKYLLSDYFNMSPKSIEATVVGEHGDSQVVLWRHVRVGGLTLEAFAAAQNMTLPEDFKEMMAQRVKDTAFDVWKMKGPNCYCVANAIQCLVEALLRPERRVLPVSNLYTTSTGLTVYISLPSIVSEQGIEKMLPELLNAEEEAQVNDSCAVMHDYVTQLTL